MSRYIGGSRYQPEGVHAGGATYSDPFTGSGAYRPGQSSSGGASGDSDPYTGTYARASRDVVPDTTIIGGGYRATAATKVRQSERDPSSHGTDMNHPLIRRSRQSRHPSISRP